MHQSQHDSPPRPKRFSLLFTIQAIFLSICLFLAGFLSLYGYFKAQEAAVVAGEKLLEEVNNSVLFQWQRILDRPARLASHLPEVPNIADKPKGLEHPARSLFVQLLNTNAAIHAIYMGWNDGDLFMVSYMEGSQHLHDDYPVPDGADFLVEYITTKNGARVSEVAFLDKSSNIVGERVASISTFDPRSRPWFRKTDEVYRVPLYMFESPVVIGTTFANSFSDNGGGVFGVDVRLDTLVDFLRRQAPGPDGRVAIFEADGTILIHDRLQSDTMSQYGAMSVKTLDDPTLSAAYTAFLHQDAVPGHPFTMESGGEKYLGVITQVGTQQADIFATIMAPMTYFTSEAVRIRNNCLIVSLAIIILAVVAVVVFSRKISTPLRTLASDTDRVRQFDLDTEVDVHSRIKEVANLASSVRSMKEGIRSFTQYVPSDLVKRYIASDTSPEIGGDRRTLTLMFTDIEGFTTLSESMNPATIIDMLSRYFSLMGAMVTQCDGTVDKYIGDALMAFWNAPERTEEHTRSGCEAALRCADAVKDHVYHSLEDQTETPLRTRFGLHRGEAVVGNMGSADRLNYTAIGAPVNIASRLEGLNKYYGTSILASAEVMQNAEGYFVFRTVDRVLPKGAVTPVTIYELAGSRPENGTPEIEVQPEQMETLGRWELMYAAYQDRRWEEAMELLGRMNPTDPLVALYISRIRTLLDDDPGPDWDGVEVMTSK